MKQKLYRSLRRCWHELSWGCRTLSAGLRLARHFGIGYARLWCSQEASARSHRPDEAALTGEKNRYIKDYLAGALKDLIQAYREAPTAAPAAEDRRIWVFWWSGFDSAPPIVRAAVRSIRSDAAVVLLDHTNYTEYITLPDDICRKHDSGVIGHAHFSDILRLSLLARYGGLWVDATVFFSRPISREVLEQDFFTCKMARQDPLVPSHYLWAGWLLGGSSSFPLFAFARDALIEYWRTHDLVIDYLLMDYIFDLAYDHLPAVRSGIDALEPGNPDRHSLMQRINEPWDPDFFRRDTWLYKLSYRYGAPKEHTPEGRMTFYGHLIREEHIHGA